MPIITLGVICFGFSKIDFSTFDLIRKNSEIEIDHAECRVLSAIPRFENALKTIRHNALRFMFRKARITQ